MPSWTGRTRFLGILAQESMQRPITAGRIAQRHVPNSFLSVLLCGYALSLEIRLLAGIPQFPEGDISFASEAGQTQFRVVFVHFLVQVEKLFETQRPRTFFAM